jgi:aldehyde:ferredoxin oxidoreductase
MSKILHINMSDLSHEWENTPKKYETLAGRAFTSTVLAKEMDPTCHPLRESNKFIVSPGLLAGTPAPSSGRLSVGGKSPLTGGIKECWWLNSYTTWTNRCSRNYNRRYAKEKGLV